MMELKRVLAVLSVLFIVSLLVTYWYLPSNSREYVVISTSEDKGNLTVITEAKQFYPNMRFSSENISYEIDESCDLKKQNDMTEAFDIINKKTILNFYPMFNGQIKIVCDEKMRMEGDLMIAGEGGPTNVSLGKYFSVMKGGRILLIKDSACPEPNLNIHELLHVLGFDHSQNSKSIMYSILSCEQKIDDVYIEKLNYLYSFPSLPDLEIQNLTASFSNRFLSYNLTIQNEGLAEAKNSYLEVYVDDKKVDIIEIDKLKIGYGERLSMTNFVISKINFDSISFVVQADFEELNKKNNEMILEVKKN